MGRRELLLRNRVVMNIGIFRGFLRLAVNVASIVQSQGFMESACKQCKIHVVQSFLRCKTDAVRKSMTPHMTLLVEFWC